MLKIKTSTKFKTDLKKIKYNQSVLNELDEVLKFLIHQKPLDKKYRDHYLTGSWIGHKECHVKPDVLLIYIVDETTLYLERISSHSDLFKN